MNTLTQALSQLAEQRAGDIFGVDPAYYGDEGNDEVERQLREISKTALDMADKLNKNKLLEAN